MQSYTVHEPPEPPADRLERAEHLVFVKDGFSGMAAFLTPLWLLSHRLWIALGAYVAALILLGLIAAIPGRIGDIGGWLLLALHLLIGFEAATIRRWTLARHGYATLASVSGRNLDECERRFFDAWLGDQPVIRPASQPAPGASSGRLNPDAFEPRRA
ncbi:MAG: DUF2628 domain-containing protein [Proteobacteria bacterium]|nr:DUF2628 domain-containing protein [Pseudomonadota bacterium]